MCVKVFCAAMQAGGAACNQYFYLLNRFTLSSLSLAVVPSLTVVSNRSKISTQELLEQSLSGLVDFPYCQ